MIKTFELTFVQNPQEDFEINLPENIIKDVELELVFGGNDVGFRIFKIKEPLKLPKPINTNIIVGWLSPYIETDRQFLEFQYYLNDDCFLTDLSQSDIYDYAFDFETLEKIEVKLFPVFDLSTKITLESQWGEF